MEMKFSGFQFLFANSPMHIKPDRPFIAFGTCHRNSAFVKILISMENAQDMVLNEKRI